MAYSIAGVNALRLFNLRKSRRKKKLAEGKWIAFIVIWCQECERKKLKEGKDEEIKGKAIRPVSKKRSSNEWDWGHCSLGELRELEQVKEKRKI